MADDPIDLDALEKASVGCSFDNRRIILLAIEEIRALRAAVRQHRARVAEMEKEDIDLFTKTLAHEVAKAFIAKMVANRVACPRCNPPPAAEGGGS